MRQRRTSLLSTLRRLWIENEWVYLIVGLMLGLLLWPLIENVQADLAGLLRDLVPEAIGITFTVLIIDRLDLMRENRLVRDQLIRQMQSRYNHTALQAVEELRVLGYLSDGSLHGRDLRGAHLQDANLYEADLRDADLRNAILRNADLYGANLAGVQVTDEQLASCQAMRWVTMPDGSKYDGRFNLYHDFEVMARKGFDARDPVSAASYYDVPLDVYKQGQQWAAAHAERLASYRAR